MVDENLLHLKDFHYTRDIILQVFDLSLPIENLKMERPIEYHLELSFI